MAQKVAASLEDDLDGGPADETVRFALGGARRYLACHRNDLMSASGLDRHSRAGGPATVSLCQRGEFHKEPRQIGRSG